MIADFGIALAGAEAGGTRLTQTGGSIGTPQYMSPEQAAGDHDVDGGNGRCLPLSGAVLYEMLTGEAPHSGKTAQATFARILSESPRPRREPAGSGARSRPNCSPWIAGKGTADRFQTAAEMVTALVDGDGHLQSDHGQEKPRRAGAWPAPFSAVIIVAFASLVGTVVSPNHRY